MITYPQLTEKWEKLGNKWHQDKLALNEWQEFKFLEKQKDFLNDKTRYCLYSGGFGCGKSLVFNIKAILLSVFFPFNFGLIGRRTLHELEISTIPDLLALIPPNWIKHRDNKNHIWTFFNDSKIIFFGLDTLISSIESDRKKAEAKIKSLNLGWFGIEQAEEVSERIFLALRGRLRRQVPFSQGFLSCNPALTWLFKYFKQKRGQDYKLFEGSTLDNEANLNSEYIKDLLQYPESWQKQFVYGVWDEALLSERAYFAIEEITRLREALITPLEIRGDTKIFKRPVKGHKYQVGADPTEGITDNCGLSVVDLDTLGQVATMKARIPADIFAYAIRDMAEYYNTAKVIPEINGIGLATLTKLKEIYSNIYYRKEFDRKYGTWTDKLGWKTTLSTKPIMYENFRRILREKKPKIYSEEVLEEMKTLVYSDSARTKGIGAEEGFFDDLITATALSYVDADKDQKDAEVITPKEALPIETTKAPVVVKGQIPNEPLIFEKEYPDIETL